MKIKEFDWKLKEFDWKCKEFDWKLKEFHWKWKECNLKCKELNQWPKVNEETVKNSEIKMVVQINGKTRDVLNVKRNLEEAEIADLVNKSLKANKYIVN